MKTPSSTKGLVRDWKSYNKYISDRAELFLDLSWLDNWISEIKEMNLNKIGQPYFYPETLIKMLAILKAKGFKYRELEGLLQSLSKKLGKFPVISFSQIRRRILELKFIFPKAKAGDIIGIDGSGLKVTNRGEWIRHKWKVRRGWIKVVLAGTTKGDIVDIEVGNEDLNEIAIAQEMLERSQAKEALLDGLHDTYKTYRVCKKQGIALRTPARAGSNPKGLNPRSEAVREQLELGRDEWSEKYNFGMRWVATEGIFSATKTIFGENLTGHKQECLEKEAILKFWAYQSLREKRFV